jgi:hypothetical protein
VPPSQFQPRKLWSSLESCIDVNVLMQDVTPLFP